MDINVIGGKLSQDEIDYYVDKIKTENPDKVYKSITLKVDGDYVELISEYDNKPFDRIRRITGYLVGTLDRFNDAKRAEVKDRVKHSLVDPKI